MRLPEHQGKAMFKKYEIATPQGTLITREEFTVGKIDYEALPSPGVVKAQNMIGGRGKAGGIKVCGSREELERNITGLFESGFSGNRVDTILVEEMIQIKKEMYLSVSIDRRAGSFCLMASGKGGVEIESMDESLMRRVWISNLIGLQKHQVAYVSKTLAEAGANVKEAAEIISGLYRLLKGERALLVEINPLVLLADGSLLAADAKVIVDDNAAHAGGAVTFQAAPSSPLEVAAKALGVNMVELDGDIAVISNGAGEGMATIDQIVHAGGRISTWVDLGGGALSAKPELLDNFIEAMMDTAPRVLLFTAFFQIGKCDLFAESFKKIYLRRKSAATPCATPKIILRLDGRNAAEAKAIAVGTDMTILDSSQEACETAVKLAGGGA